MKKPTILIPTFLYAILILPGLFSTARAQPGSLDAGFGTGGIAFTDHHSFSFAGDLAIQPDGKLLVSGGSTAPIARVARFNVDGTLDSSFGIAGEIHIDLGEGGYSAEDIAIQGSNKILVAIGNSTYTYEFITARIEFDGTPDTTFGENGFAITCKEGFITTGCGLTTEKMDVQPDGRFVVGGRWLDTYLYGAVAQYTAEGNADTIFGDSGLFLQGFIPDDIIFNDVKYQSDGKIVACGYGKTIFSPTNYLFVLRLLNDGQTDPDFGTDGLAAIPIDGQISINSLDIQNDGKIVIAGELEVVEFLDNDMILARLLANGEIDSSFGSDGIVTLDVSTSYERIRDVEVNNDGRILVCGSTNSSGTYDFLLTCFNADGTLDPTFGSDGMVITDMNNDLDRAYAMELQDDGKIAVSGFTNDSISGRLAIVRYNFCSAYFSLLPDTIPHYWNAINMAVGTEPIEYLWSWGDGTTSDEAFPTHTYAEPGYYEICLSITDANGCTSTYCNDDTYLYRTDQNHTMITVNVIAEATTPVETVHAAELNLYPNPFSDLLILESTTSGLAEIFDISGNRLLMQEISGNSSQLDTGNLLPGIYVVTFTNNSNVLVRKMIKL